jgi:hypothetical protein
MDEINEFGDSIDRLAGSVNDPKASAMLIKEAEKWHRLQAKIEKRYLSPERMDIKWQ